MGRPIKQTVSNYKKLCDGVFSKYIRRDSRCFRCGRTDGRFDCAHVISRKNLILRWDISNAMCLCFQCHRWWHEEPFESGEWYKSKEPKNYEFLQYQRNKIIKRTLSDYQELYEQLKSL